MSKIIFNLFNCSIIEYLQAVAYIFTTNFTYDYFNNFNDIYDDKYVKDVGINIDVIRKIIEYYTITYNDVRNNNFKQLVLYSKPFVQNKVGKTLCSNIFNLYFVLGNCLYWLIRDYYKYNNDDTFLSRFGKVYEKYFYDVFI